MKKIIIFICSLSLILGIVGCVPAEKQQREETSKKSVDDEIEELESRIEESETELEDFEISTENSEIGRANSEINEEIFEIGAEGLASENFPNEQFLAEIHSNDFSITDSDINDSDVTELKIQRAELTSITSINDEMCNITFTCVANDTIYTATFEDYYYLPELEVPLDERVGLKFSDINHDGNDEIILKVYAVGNTFADLVGNTHVFSFHDGILKETLYIDTDVIDDYWVVGTSITDGNLCFTVDTKHNEDGPKYYMYEFMNDEWILYEHPITDEQFLNMDWF